MAVKRFISDLLTPAAAAPRPADGARIRHSTCWGGLSMITVSKEAAVAAVAPVPLIAAVGVDRTAGGRCERIYYWSFSYRQVLMKAKPVRAMDASCLRLGMLTLGCERLTGPSFLGPVLLLRPVNR